MSNIKLLLIQTSWILFVLITGVCAHDIALHELPPPTTSETIRKYLMFGYEHIIPLGPDHILFILGLFLLSAKLKPLVWQITMFTVAHTVTLALSVLGLISLSPNIVEPLIALSITYIALENIVTSRLMPARTAVVFCFGLMHGLGFAGILHETGIPEDKFFPALISFNVGVELAQISIVFLAVYLVGRFEDRSWYRKRVVIPCSTLIALIGIYWVYRRIFAGG
ncbi:MAG: HupE/UreJ family protein [Candidatus Omnitrophota bacterium]